MRSDEDLLTAAARGDDEAFALFYRRHLDAVIAFLRRRVPSPELAFDLAAETFAVIACAPDRYRAEGPPIGWVYGIARNLLRSSLRRGRIEDAARRRIGLDVTELTDANLAAIDERADAGGPALAAALAALPETTRAALLARIVDERGYRDIADELGCSELVVRQRVHRGLTRLRAGLEESP